MFDELKVYLSDGGLGAYLEQLEKHRKSFVGDPLWSSRLLVTDPESLVACHEEFLNSGSELIQTNSYQASVDLFCKELGVSVARSEEIICSSVRLARNACKNTKKEDTLVGGTIGPYGACLHDGSEYHGNYVDTMSVEELMDWHRPRMRLLVETGVDFLRIETIPALKEVEALIRLLREFPGMKAWVAVSCKDNVNSRHGEPLTACLQPALLCDQVVAVGINCTSPWFISPLLKSIQQTSYKPKPLVVYPNSGEGYQVGEGFFTTDGHKKWTGMSDGVLTEVIRSWVDDGVRIIGGCCRMFPSDILRISKCLQELGDIKNC